MFTVAALGERCAIECEAGEGLAGDGLGLLFVTAPILPRRQRAALYCSWFTSAGTIPKRLTFKRRGRRNLWRQIMADKLGPLSDGSPRDASKMGSNSHASLYVGLVLAAIVIGFALYWFSMT
jgi:hypothetical protein